VRFTNNRKSYSWGLDVLREVI